MKKVKSYENIKIGTIFSINQAGNIYHYPLDTIVEGETVAWEDLAVGTMYYESNDIDGVNQDSIKDLDVIGGKGILIYKNKKNTNNSMSIGGLNITIISDKQRKIKCYKAKDKSPCLIVHKIQNKEGGKKGQPVTIIQGDKPVCDYCTHYLQCAGHVSDCKGFTLDKNKVKQ